jgi:type IV pilus assembly protein PilF
MRREQRCRWLAIAAALALLGGCTHKYGRSGSSLHDEPAPVATEKTDPVNAANVNLGLAKGYFEQGDLKDAMEKLQKATTLNPKLAEAHSLLGLVYEQIGQPKEGDAEHRKAVELKPKSGAMNNNYGAFLCRQGHFEEADARFVQALSDPFYETPQAALANRGSCAKRWGKNDLAEGSFRDALKRRPDQPDVLLPLAQILYEKGDYFRARAFLQRYEELSKASAESLELAMNIEGRLGNESSAAEYRKRLETEFPDSEQARHVSTAEDKG